MIHPTVRADIATMSLVVLHLLGSISIASMCMTAPGTIFATSTVMPLLTNLVSGASLIGTLGISTVSGVVYNLGLTCALAL